MIPQSAKLFSNNYTTKAATKSKKVLIDGWQTDTGEITYMQKSRHMYSCVRNTSAVIFPDLKRYCIQPEQLFYGKKWILTLFTCLPVKVTDFQWLRSVIYQVGLKQNPFALFLLGQQIFFGSLSFSIMVVWENQQGQKTRRLYPT